MRIAIINRWDVAGGAARAAYRLYRALQLREKDVRYIVNEKESNEEEIVAVANSEGFDNRLSSLVQQYYIDRNRTDLTNTWFSFSRHGIDLRAVPFLLDADIINLHWVEQFISLKNLRQIVDRGKPIVWTLHDQRPFTGGCHYTSGCTFFANNCKDCPQLLDDPHSLAATQLQQKKEVLHNANLTIVSPSRWLAREAAKSKLFCDRRIEVVPNSIETDIYTPIAKEEAKKKIGIKEDITTLMFGAKDNSEKRKGFDVLLDALGICLKTQWFAELSKKGKLLVVVVGKNTKDLQELPFPVKQLGYIASDQEMATVYNATDLFILPSLEDNLPNTILESMACGTPVVAFDTGGIPDMVQHGHNGWLVERGNAGKLAEAILNLVHNTEKRQILRRNCRRYIKQHYTGKLQAEKYLELFADVLKTTPKKTRKKRDFSDLERAYDSVIGYSISKHFQVLQQNGDTPSRIAKILGGEHERLLRLQNVVEEICRIRLLRHPVKKYRAYQKILKTYREKF